MGKRDLAWLNEQLGAVYEKDGFTIEVTEEMIEAVETYIEYVNDLRKAIGPHAIVKFEEKVTLEEVNAVMFGTADCVIIHPYKCVHIIDFKYGQGKRVSVYRNKQLMYYALGVMLKEDCPHFRLHIVQPRVEDGISDYAADEPNELETFHRELKEHAEEALKPKAPLNPGDWCKSSFCPARATCKALQALSRELTVKDFDETPLVETLTMEQITKVLKYETTVKDWMSKVRDHAKELMLQGVNIPGYKIVKAQGNAKWVDEKAVIAEFEDELGDKLYQKDLISPAQLEKLVGKKKLGANFRDEWTMRPDNGYKIVEEDEKGETVKTIKAQEDFNG